MKDSYLSGRDLYAWMASEVYNKDYNDCMEFKPDGSVNPEGKKRRTSMKSILLGLMYGRGTGSVAEQLGVSKQEAQRIIDLFFGKFPAIKQVIEYYENLVRTKGYTQTAYGRKRRLPDYNLPEFEFVQMEDKKTPIDDPNVEQYYLNLLENAWAKQKFDIKQTANKQGIWIVDNGLKIAEAGRQILNSVVQGSAADITKKAMLQIGTDPLLKELGFKMLLTVHDEIIGEAPKQNAIQASKRMEEIMINCITDRISVPMSVDCEILEKWFGEDITQKIS